VFLIVDFDKSKAHESLRIDDEHRRMRQPRPSGLNMP
jgi:hypothetical protein